MQVLIDQDVYLDGKLQWEQARVTVDNDALTVQEPDDEQGWVKVLLLADTVLLVTAPMGNTYEGTVTLLAEGPEGWDGDAFVARISLRSNTTGCIPCGAGR